MTAEWQSDGYIAELGSRAALDTAKGVLVGLRRCSPDRAFHDLIDCAHEHRVPVFALAGALVDLATRRQSADWEPGPAHTAAQRQWGHLFVAVNGCRID